MNGEATEMILRETGEIVTLTPAAFDLITPEEFALQIDREDKMRKLLINYMQRCMKPDHHYYWLNKADKEAGKKPAISKEGSLNLCSLFKVMPLPDDPVITDHGDGHLTFNVRVPIKDARGRTVALGFGIASTRESVFRGRGEWIPEWELPDGFDKDNCDVQTKDKKSGGTFRRYRVKSSENPADALDRAQKQAIKRATTDGVTKLWLVSELFSQGYDPTETETRKDMEMRQGQKVKVQAESNDDAPRVVKPTNGADWSPASEGAEWTESNEMALELFTRIGNKPTNFYAYHKQFLAGKSAEERQAQISQLADRVAAKEGEGL